MSKKVLGCLLVAAMITSAFSSCGNSSSNTSSSSGSESSSSSSSSSFEAESSSETSSAAWEPNFDEEPYTVYFQYCVAAESSGQQAVSDALNELTLKELNMKVELIPQTMGTWTTNMSMILAANEPLDLFLSGSGSFGTYIESGYVLDWGDYMDYVPDVIEGMGEDINAGYVGDFLMGFSQMKERGYQSGLIARKDIMDELGYSPDDFSITTEDYSTYEQLDELFAAVKEKYPDMIAVGGTAGLPSLIGNYNDNLGNNFGMLEDYGQSLEVVNVFEGEQYKTFCEIARRWFEAGYESADAATNQDGGETLMKAGNMFSFLTNVKPNTDVEKLAQTGYEVYVIPVAENTFTSSMSVNAIVYSLANASEDPVKAAAFYNWCYTSEEFANLINWGVEGVDWVRTEDNLAAYPEGIDATSVSYHQDFGWAYPNQMAGHAWEGNEVDIWDQYDEFNQGDVVSEGFGFRYDNRPVLNQVIACQAVNTQYQAAIVRGTATDLDAAIDEYNAKLYEAGLQDIIDEKQRQLNEWQAAQG